MRSTIFNRLFRTLLISAGLILSIPVFWVLDVLVSEYLPDIPEGPAKVEIALNKSGIIQIVDERFVSISIDSAQFVGGRWWNPNAKTEAGIGAHSTSAFDFQRPKLNLLAKALAPAYLRIGGSFADLMLPNEELSPGQNMRPQAKKAEAYYTAEQWDQLMSFARANNFYVMFTVNSGASALSEEGNWDPNSLRGLLQYARKNQHPVSVWEFGNELNGYFAHLGPWAQPSASHFIEGFKLFRSLVKSELPEARVAGPASAYWPVLGEPFRFLFGMMEPFISSLSDKIDILTWHYYPQQSRRCAVAVRRASREKMLHPDALNEISKWSESIQKGALASHSNAEVWLGETGNAQCGGEPGVSDSFLGSIWWLDQLGMAAKLGQKVVVRQSLTGSDYGLLSEPDLSIRPDYWVTLLWKRLMGTQVLDVSFSHQHPKLRLYAHCHAKQKGMVSWLAINLSQTNSVEVEAPYFQQKENFFLVEATSANMSEIKINAEPLPRQLPNSIQNPNALIYDRFQQQPILVLNPLQVAFWVTPEIDSKYCH